MSEAGPIPVFPQGANDVSVYEYQEWPAWRYTADGRGKVFNNADEVPEGWMTHAEMTGLTAEVMTAQTTEPGDGEPVIVPVTENERELTADQRRSAITKLVDGNQQKDLVTMLELMNEKRVEEDLEELEFGSTWPKLKLAETIVDNGGPLED